VTDEQIRLYAIARVVTPPETRIRTLAESAGPFSLATIYTLVLKTPGGTLERWFAVHSSSLRSGVPDAILGQEIARSIAS